MVRVLLRSSDFGKYNTNKGSVVGKNSAICCKLECQAFIKILQLLELIGSAGSGRLGIQLL